jgi:hypothetical protein
MTKGAVRYLLIGVLGLMGVLGLLALPSAAVIDAVATPLSASSTGVGVQPCAGKAEVRPSTFTISCADGNSYLTKLKWSAWGSATASAKGVYTVNTCDPYCAAGKFVSSDAVVTLSKPKTFKGQRLFTNLHVGYVSGPRFKSFNFALLT